VGIFNATLGRLEALFKAQRRFVADVSHELRTPLTVIQGSVDLIKRYDDKDALDAIAGESKRMTRLVGDLLLLAQADAGELPMLKQPLELDTLVLEVFEQAQVLAPDGPAIRLGRFDAVRVNADPDRLKQLLLNLLGNAIKYTPPDGTITLSVWPNGPEALLSVADTGEGIPAEDLPVHLRPLLPGGQGPRPQAGRRGVGAGHRALDRRGPPGLDHGAQHDGQNPRPQPTRPGPPSRSTCLARFHRRKRRRKPCTICACRARPRRATARRPTGARLLSETSAVIYRPLIRIDYAGDRGFLRYSRATGPE
jgi:hypothetical protein